MKLKLKTLHGLFRKLSSSLVDDAYISKEEFQLGLFRNRNEQSLFADRVKEMILALLDESDLILPDDVVETIVDKDADSDRDGKIDLEEWKEFVARNPIQSC
ncbi:hypothetical protein CRYUN_Cryun19dG0111800 [Craigia yunnanensis]